MKKQIREMISILNNNPDEDIIKNTLIELGIDSEIFEGKSINDLKSIFLDEIIKVDSKVKEEDNKNGIRKEYSYENNINELRRARGKSIIESDKYKVLHAIEREVYLKELSEYAKQDAIDYLKEKVSKEEINKELI